MKTTKWLNKHREPKTEIKFVKGSYYKYAVEYVYNAVKKRTDKITKGIIGKLTEEEGLIPSDKNRLKEAALQIPKVDIKTYGVYNLFSTLLADDINSLHELFKRGVFETLLPFAMMRWAYQSPIKRMADYHAHDFCSEHWSTDGINDKQITDTLKFVGENRQALVSWMKSRLNLSDPAFNNFVLMDSTHVPTVSEYLQINTKGYNPSHSFDEQVRLMYIFSAELKQPIYYRLINGNITDTKSMAKCVKELNVENVIFIADKGFYSILNIKQLQENQLNYIIPIQRNNKLINLEPLQKANYKKKIKKYFVYQHRIIWHYEYKKEGQKLITFLDEKLKVKEEADYLLRVKTHPDTNSEEKFYDKLPRFGTLTLVYDLKENLHPQQLYEAYKQRNEIEIMFDSYKNFLQADKTYMQNRYVLEGWLMANFIAMIAYYRLYSKLKENNLLSKYSPKDIIEISKSIYQTKIRGEWRLSEITIKHTRLFKKIGIDYLIERS